MDRKTKRPTQVTAIMDYDRTDIPASYDRGRDHGPQLLELWMSALAAYWDADNCSRILDLGCGTGRFADALSVRFNAEVIGVDPSLKMLNQARHKRYEGRVRYQLGRAEALPLRSGSVDLIFLSMSFHHFGDPRLAARECRRVLREDGMVMVRTGIRERVASYPYYPFFPASHPILEEVLPDSTTVRSVFADAGFHLVAQDVVTQTIAPNWEVYADKLAAGADSVLARLDPGEFEDGLAALRQHAAETAVDGIIEPIDLFVFR